MGQSEVPSELDQLSIRLLEVLEQSGGTATSSELKNIIGHDSTRRINYRKSEYLEPAGWIETTQPEPVEPGNFPPQEWSITEQGVEFLESREEYPDEYRDIGERVELLEDQLDGLQEQLTDVRESRERIEDIQSQLTELAAGLNEIEDVVNSLKNDALFQSEDRRRINAALIAGSIAMDVFEDEYGEETVSEWFDQKDAELTQIPE